MIELGITFDSVDLTVKFGRKAFDRFVRAGGDMALYALRKYTVSEATRKKALKPPFVRKKTSIKRPGRNFNPWKSTWAEIVLGDLVSLREYSYTESGRGVSVQVNRGASVQLSHSFVVTLASGHKAIFERPKISGAFAERLPIREIWSSRVSETVDDSTERLLNIANREFQRGFFEAKRRAEER